MRLKSFVTIGAFAVFMAIRSTAAWAIDAAKLRDAASLPHMNFQLNMQFKFDRLDGFVVNQIKPAPEVEIAQLKDAMDGKTDDSERNLRVAELLSESDAAGAKTAREKALALRRADVKKNPKDGFAHVQLAWALRALEQSKGAENEMRAAQKLAPKDWRVWSEWGEYLAGKIDFSAGLKPDASAKALADMQAQARRNLIEAQAAHDKAVQLAPDEPYSYIHRALFKMTRSLISLWIESGMPANWQTSGEAAMQSIASWPALMKDDIQSAAKLAREPRLTSNLHLVQGYLELVSGMQGDDDDDKDKVLAKVETLMRLAISLDPTNAAANEGLSGTLLLGNRYDDFAKLQEARLKYEDTPTQRVTAAKAFGKIDDYKGAQRHISAALKLDPNDFLANLSQAALLLRRDDKAATAQAGAILDKWKDAPQTKQGDGALDYNLLRGIYLGLNGKADEARELIGAIVEADPENETFAQALAALTDKP